MNDATDQLKMEAYRTNYDADSPFMPQASSAARAVCFRETYPDRWNGIDRAARAALEHPQN